MGPTYPDSEVVWALVGVFNVLKDLGDKEGGEELGLAVVDREGHAGLAGILKALAVVEDSEEKR